MTADRWGPNDDRALASVATQFFLNGVVFATVAPRLPEIRDALGITVGTLGAVLSAGAVFGLLQSTVAGSLIERLGTRRILVAGAIGLFAALPVIGLATNVWLLTLGLAMIYSLDVMVDVAMNLQGSWLSARRHAPVMNRLHGLWSLGTVVGGLATAGLASIGVPVREHLIGTGVLLLGATVFVSRGLLRDDEAELARQASAPRLPDDSGDLSTAPPLSVDTSPGGAPADGAPTAPSPVDHGPVVDTSPSDSPPVSQSALRRTMPLALAAMALAGAFAIVMEVTSSEWAAFRMADDFGVSAGFAGLGFVAYTSGMTIGRLSGDAVQVWLGARRLLQLAIVVAAVGMAGQSLIPNRYLVLVAFVFAGIGNAPFFPRLYDMAAKLPGQTGRGLGALTGGSRAAGITGPLIVGSLAATSLSVGSAMALVTLPSIIAFALVTVRQTR